MKRTFLLVSTVWVFSLALIAYSTIGVKIDYTEREKYAIGFESIPRSHLWPKVRKAYLEKNPTCAACGCSEFLEVHHVVPFAKHPELELDTNNFITLCQKPGHNCHFHLGHLLSWKSYNSNVRVDSASFLRKVQNRP